MARSESNDSLVVLQKAKHPASALFGEGGLTKNTEIDVNSKVLRE